jgi:hypothetical protein
VAPPHDLAPRRLSRHFTALTSRLSVATRAIDRSFATRLRRAMRSPL